MKMTLKVDENNQAVLQDGKPVYVTEDGKDFVADVPSLYDKTLELKGESKRHREKLEAAEAQVTIYRNLFPDMDGDALVEWKNGADEALTTVKNLGDKELLDAGKVEQIKTELKDAHDANLKRVKDGYQAQEQTYQQTISSKDAQIYDLMVGNAFATSKYFGGKDPLTVYLPDAAIGVFGSNFKVEEDKNTNKLRIVGYFNGTEILSKQPDMVGEIAPFEEALEYIIDKYPHKDRIMAAGRSGSGAGGGQGGTGEPDNDLAMLKKQYDEAVKANDGKRAISLKNRIHALQQTAA